MIRKAVPVCETGVRVQMTEAMRHALREAGHKSETRGYRAGTYLLRGGKAFRLRDYELYSWPSVQQNLVIDALASRRTLPAPMEFLGFPVMLDVLGHVRVGCSVFQLADVRELRRVSDAMVRRSRPSRRPRAVRLGSRVITVNEDGGIIFMGFVYPRECLRAVTDKLNA